ncbi:aldehyde dehydrogenase [Brevibacterium sp. VCM10]|uniref:aldehyde dehydrogenase n=1 Tax=Brevibacterium sp. VCM10 TaxID=1381751 RepID=UPI0004720173|nr:aldehyde dehydrogenase [Brevibacterium sp. VCM10]
MSTPTTISPVDKLFVGGEWTSPASSKRIDLVTPSTAEVFTTIPDVTEADVDAAVRAARSSFDSGVWRKKSLDERIQVLSKVSELLGERIDEVAGIITTEMGSPITLSTKMQAMGSKMLLDALIELAPQYQWRDTRKHATGNALVEKEPVGVVAAVVPWNAPLQISIIKLTPALLAGCSVVLKPTPQTALNAFFLADLLSQAGLPEGVLSVLPADREVSAYLSSHPGVDKVSFTGSTAAGRKVAAQCGNDLRRCTLELGGKSAAVVLADADLDQVIPAIRALSLRNTGQVCSNKTRIVAARSIRDELNDRLAEMMRSMPVGDPFDPDVEIGPLASAAQLERVLGYIESGKSSGAGLLLGGDRPSDLGAGYYVSPTVFTDVDPNAKIAQEEIFGPVLTTHYFDTEEEAIAIANNSDYGLNGSVFSADVYHALDVAREIRTGTVEVNGNGGGFYAPIGGFKNSGIGREAGLEGFDAYVEIKSYGLPAEVVDTFA